MKPNKASRLRLALLARIGDPVSAAVLGASFLLGLVLLLFLGPGAAVSVGMASGIEVGKVSDREIVADRDIRYVDGPATALRLEAEERLVLPVFLVDEKVGRDSLERFRAYQDLLLSLSARSLAPESLYLQVQSAYPGVLAKKEVLGLAGFPLRAQAFSNADAVLRRIFEAGIAALPDSGLERYNPDYVEVRRPESGKTQGEDIPSRQLITLARLDATLEAELQARRLSPALAAQVAVLVKGFIQPNTFFDAEQSRSRMEIVRLKVDPVVKTIPRGDHLVRKGFVVTESDFARLQAAATANAHADWGRLLGDAGLFLLLAAFVLLLLGPEITGASLPRSELALASVVGLLFFGAATALVRFAGLDSSIYVAILLPTALITLVLAVLVGQRFSLLYGLVLACLVLLATGLDASAFALTLISAEAGAFMVRKANSRIDLVRAGAALAVVEGLAAAILSAPGAKSFFLVLGPAAWGSVNGFLCGVLSLALIPVLEQALNAPTRFRLMELSDLNAPILKRLLTVAPGTYSHSVTVAHLAESACREIGADPLLARVGAYYHDIGKIEQPEYFVENQTGYNKHDDINPRLSVTVIRSHVKLGVEKARSLGLPEAIVSVIGEHHGNSRIHYFYSQALKDDPEAKAEDFSYPGQTPGSREAAVVMLADTVEAATRTLKRPTLGRLEEFIKELVMEKVRQGQLDRCELTFHDLEVIQDSFARILAGHFHSRIEYPKMRGEAR